MTLHEAEKQEGEGSLFVMNQARPVGNINMNYTTSRGTREALHLPISFIPIDVSMYGEKNAILHEPNFRRQIAAGNLVIVNPEDARDLIDNDPRAKKELNRINGLNNLSVEGEQQSDSIELDMGSDKPSTAEGEAPTGSETDPAIARFIDAIIERSNADVADEATEDLISDLDQKSTMLSADDLIHISDRSGRAEIKDWAINEFNNRGE
jgi:hypothetical protein